MYRLTYITFISVLIFAPLAFGTVEKWSLTLVESLSFCLFLFILIPVIFQKKTIYEVPALVPLICFQVYLLFQTIPLPINLVKLISPATHTLYHDTLGSIYSPEWVSLSIHPRATLSEFFRFSAYTSIYILTVQLLTKRTLLKTTIKIVTIFATLLAILAMVQHFTAAQAVGRKILWFRELTHGGAPFGPYVNRNHYAGWMGMIFPIILSLFLFYTPKGVYRSFRQKVMGVLTQEQTNTYILLGLSVFLISGSIFMTLSRGGIISLCLASFALAIMVAFAKLATNKGVLIISGFSILVLCMGWFGWEPIFNRFDAIRNLDGGIAGQRLTIWKDTLNLVNDFPVTGSGFGTFRDLYPKYRHFTGDLIVQHAHNDYLELLAEGGLLSVLLVLSVFMVFFYKSFRAFRKRRDPFSIYLFIGSLAGMISIFIHSLIDFNLHIGANGLYVFFLMGLNISAANTRISCQKQDTHLKTIQLPRPIITGLLVVIFILFMVAVNIAGLVSELNYASIRDVRLNQNLSETATSKIHQRALRACRLDPLEPKYRFAAANIEAFLLNEDLAQRQYLAALRLNPTRGEYLQQLALRMSDRGNFDAADKLFQASIGYHSSDPGTYFAYAVWLLTRGRKASALENLNLAIALDHRKIENGLTLMVIHGLSASEMQKAIPEKVKPQLHFADFLHQTGKTEMADGVYRRALKFVKNEATANVSHFNKVYLYYLNNDRIDDAIEILNQAMKYFPTDPHLRLKAAALYERKGIIHHAIEEYKRVLVIDPENRHAKRKLRKIMSQ